MKQRAQKPIIKKKNRISGTFTLERSPLEGNIKLPFIYSDSLFFGTSANFSIQLARMSMNMAYASFNHPDIKNGCKNLEEFLGILGFNNFVSNIDYHTMPSADSIGVGIASKNIVVNGVDYTLVYVGLRGGNYKCEWAGNFHVGEGGNHLGFTISSNKAYSELVDYLTLFDIKGNVKIWSSGFSRGAATCNMLGGLIADNIDKGNKLKEDINLNVDDLYFYCFETPQGVVTESLKSSNIIERKYAGIHNIINVDDLVPRMGPSAMGFRRYGNDFILPAPTSPEFPDILEKVYKYYESIDNGPTLKLIQRYFNKFKYRKTGIFQDIPSAAQFLDRAMMHMSEIAHYRKGMYDIEEEIMNFLVLLSNYDSSSNNAYIKYLFNEVTKDADKIILNILSPDDSRLQKTVYNIIERTFNGNNVKDYNQEKAMKFALTFGDFYTTFANKYPEDAINVALNIFSFVAPHDPLFEISFLEQIEIPSYEMKI